MTQQNGILTFSSVTVLGENDASRPRGIWHAQAVLLVLNYLFALAARSCRSSSEA